MNINCRKNMNGFTLIELMIVVAIIGILASIAIPNFLNLKDKAIWGTARANLDVIRSSLASYAAANPASRYPIGPMDFGQFKIVLPHASLPETEILAKFHTGTFTYSSLDGTTFSVSANTANRAFDLLTASPSGITPNSYDDYVR